MIIAVIPARGGSKRIPRKNIKDFCGKPMVAWSIEAAKQSQCFDDIIVSTDDGEIAEVARAYGASVPFFRPQQLADDFTGTNAVVVHAQEYVKQLGHNVSATACIYATAPFLTGVKIREGLDCLKETKNAQYAVTVTSYSFPIQRSLKMNSRGMLNMREPKYARCRSQDLDQFYHDAGQLYWGYPESFNDYPSVMECDIAPIFLHPNNVQDIDTPEDWEVAEYLFQLMGRGSND